MPADLFPGYTLLAGASRGGQGTVYEAIEKTTKRRVAIKVLHAGPLAAEANRARFEREIQILGSLQHPHIVTIHGSGTANGCCY